MADARAQIKFFGRKCGRKVKSRQMAESTNTHELNLRCALAVWAAVLLTGVVAGLHMGFAGWKFGCAMAASGIFLAGLHLSGVPSCARKQLQRGAAAAAR